MIDDSEDEIPIVATFSQAINLNATLQSKIYANMNNILLTYIYRE